MSSNIKHLQHITVKLKLYKQTSSYYYNVPDLSLDWDYEQRMDAFSCPDHHGPYATICPEKDSLLLKLI